MGMRVGDFGLFEMLKKYGLILIKIYILFIFTDYQVLMRTQNYHALKNQIKRFSISQKAEQKSKKN